MSKHEVLYHEDFKAKQRSIVLLHGIFEPRFIEGLKTRLQETFYIMEGRPSLQAAQINCRRLNKIGITPTLICDNMAGFLFAKDLVKEVYIAYESSDEQGSYAAIGSLILAVLALRHQIPVKAVPMDPQPKVSAVAQDLAFFMGKRVAPKGVKTFVPTREFVSKKYYV
ncbi:MAG: hypothetical protein HQL23_06590 [Candidatus Omnitrophica bacterium]|nr:hypothetical protein [Candidatus Omnitrophota bacterium]